MVQGIGNIMEKINEILENRWHFNGIFAALVTVFVICGANSGLSVLDVSVFYMITMILSYNWSMFCKDVYKYFVFGFCSFISIVLSIAIFDVDVLLITCMTVISQLYTLLIILKGNK